MKKSKFSEAQIATALRQVEAGAPIPDVTRALGIREATYYVWRKPDGQMVIAEIQRRQLEEENRKLKQLVSDLTLDTVILHDALDWCLMRTPRFSDLTLDTVILHEVLAKKP